MRTPPVAVKTSRESSTRDRQRVSFKPLAPKRLLAGMGMSIATGMALGKMTRGPLSHQVETFDHRLLGATEKVESPVLDPVMAFFSDMGEPQAL